MFYHRRFGRRPVMLVPGRHFVFMPRGAFALRRRPLFFWPGLLMLGMAAFVVLMAIAR